MPGAGPIDEALLDAKLAALERARPWSPRVVSKLESLLRSPEGERAFRVNVLDFAEEGRVAEDEAVDLFLHATKLGLLNMEWQLVCPQCTDSVESARSLSEIGPTYHCELCSKDIETSLDELIQVTFTVSPMVRRLALHDPEALPIEEYCFKYHFSTGARAPGGELWRDSLGPFIAMLAWIEPGRTHAFSLDLREGKLKGADRVHRAEIDFRVRPTRAASEQRIALRLDAGGFSRFGEEIDAGPTVVEIHNATARRAAIVAINVGPTGRPPAARMPRFLTGKRLFVTQTFADLFRSETVGKGLGLKDLTFLFTDMKGSTGLYDRIGDLPAFQLVEQHFEHLAQVVRAHRGAVVKTIGDAVMACFGEPADAASAALAMRQTIHRFNQQRGEDDVILNIGLHRGSVIAVTSNDRLDYFGQTVNIAARAQGQAESGDICLTDAVFTAPGVAELLAPHDPSAEGVRLKGIERVVRLHRIRARHAAR